MRTRLELHNILVNILGSRNVYFQRPENIRLDYPCILYSVQSKDPKYADDKRYLNKTKYKVTVVDEDPDSEIPSKLEELMFCSFDTHYCADGLNHFVFLLYF